MGDRTGTPGAVGLLFFCSSSIHSSILVLLILITLSCLHFILLILPCFIITFLPLFFSLASCPPFLLVVLLQWLYAAIDAINTTNITNNTMYCLDEIEGKEAVMMMMMMMM